jgi:putative acetyltransferase
VILRDFDGADGLDGAATLEVFLTAVRQTARRDYTAAQVAAWAPSDMDPVRWNARRAAAATIVAVEEPGGRLIGFSDIDPSGYIDMMFVAPDMVRKGVASALLAAVVDRARSRGSAELTTFGSTTARPFFERNGFVVTEECRAVIGGIELPTFAMRRCVEERP